MKPPPKNQQRTLKVNCAKIESVQIYEVQEAELDQIAEGGSGGILLNFGVFFASSALSILAALMSGTFSNIRVFQIFVIITVVSAIAAAVLLSLWWRKRNDIACVISKIRKRLQ